MTEVHHKGEVFTSIKPKLLLQKEAITFFSDLIYFKKK